MPKNINTLEKNVIYHYYIRYSMCKNCFRHFWNKEIIQCPYCKSTEIELKEEEIGGMTLTQTLEQNCFVEIMPFPLN